MITSKPLGDRVLVEALPKNEEKTTEAGFFIPDSASTEDVKFTTVVAVGDGIFTQSGTPIPMSVKVGDTVIVPKAVVTQIIVDRDEYYVCREVEILSIIKD